MKNKMIILLAVMTFGLTACSSSSEDYGDRYANASWGNMKTIMEAGLNPEMASISIKADDDAIKEALSKDIAEIYSTISEVTDGEVAETFIEVLLLDESELLTEYGAQVIMGGNKDYEKAMKNLKDNNQARLKELTEELKDKYEGDKTVERAIGKAMQRLVNMKINKQYLANIVLANSHQ